MKIGIVGCGKLGMPVAVAIDLKGHDVMCHDIDPNCMQNQRWPYRETGPDGQKPFIDFLRTSDVHFGTLEQVVEHAEILFVAVQTPHGPQFEGVTRLPVDRADFNYQYLETALGDINRIVETKRRHGFVVAVISTVLPGTFAEKLMHDVGIRVSLVYNPSFIAMGTVMRDFLNPEFVLIGAEDGAGANKMQDFYRTITSAPQFVTEIPNAEMIKVFYNTFISMKIAFANTIMETAHKIGANADEVVSALSLANKRLISPAYLRGGMGDGGGCHPRDNIAMSWLAQKLDIRYDLFGRVMEWREEQAEWLCSLVEDEAHLTGLPIAILGTAFKAGTNIETGSAALLCKEILEGWGNVVAAWDPLISEDAAPMRLPHVYLIGCKHLVFEEYIFPPGSVIIDPHRYIPQRNDRKVISVGGYIAERMWEKR